jgi:hypothetical protein
MMIDNYSMGDTVVRATAFLSGTKARPPPPFILIGHAASFTPY